jgi:protein FrlC
MSHGLNALGARKVIYIAGWQIFGTTRQEAWSRSRDCLDRIAAYAGQKDITIVVEPTAAATNLIETADDAIELMRSVEHSNVKLMFDTLHALYRNEIPADYARAMGKDLVHIHVSDKNRVLPGEGQVDWEGLLQVLRESDFDGFITMEVGLDARSADPDRIARTALAYLKDVESKVNASAGLSEEKRALRG